MNKNLAKNGEKYNRLTVISDIYKKSGNRRYFVDVLCDCGTIKTVREYSLREGLTKSCGCLRKENTENLNKSHGMYRSGAHISWTLMKQRCLNPKDPSYGNYGGRGITYDPHWESFENFYRDMGERPEGMTLDRIDVNGNYTKENCRWALDSVQAHNRRKMKFLGDNPTTSVFVGVSYVERSNKWLCKLIHSGKVVFRKLFEDELLAAKTYDDISFEVYGDRPNEIKIKEKIKNECYR